MDPIRDGKCVDSECVLPGCCTCSHLVQDSNAFANAGPGTEMLFYEGAAHAIASVYQEQSMDFSPM